jgi:hypothetical protein
MSEFVNAIVCVNPRSESDPDFTMQSIPSEELLGLQGYRRGEGQ